jgi:hypothetical protein
MFLETIYPITYVPPEIQLRLLSLHLIEVISYYSFSQIMTSMFPFTLSTTAYGLVITLNHGYVEFSEFKEKV